MLVARAAALAPLARMVGGADLPSGARPREEAPGGGAAVETTARGVDPGTGEPLMHLHTPLHGTDRLMVQALKTDLDLPVTTQRRQAQTWYVLASKRGNKYFYD